MTTKGLPAIQPGEYLKEALDEPGLTRAQFACAFGISAIRTSQVVKGTRPLTAGLGNTHETLELFQIRD